MIEKLRTITGPLGPFVTWEQRLAAQEEWKNSLSVSDIVRARTMLEMTDAQLTAAGMDAEETIVLVLEGLAELAEAGAYSGVIPVLEALLEREDRRPAALEAMGTMQASQVEPLLAHTLSRLPGWGEDSAIALASTLGMLRSENAKEMLERLAAMFPENEDVLNEIQIAREA